MKMHTGDEQGMPGPGFTAAGTTRGKGCPKCGNPDESQGHMARHQQEHTPGVPTSVSLPAVVKATSPARTGPPGQRRRYGTP